jgi:transcriptional regulator with XRE-family HTH domain
VVISDRLRALRKAKNLSQEDVEERAGLLCCYLSGVENGGTVPTIETLEDIACALDVPLYQLFYDGEEPPALPNLPNRRSAEEIASSSRGEAKLTAKGVQEMGGRAYNGLNGSAIRQGISFHRNWAAEDGAMDLHCPRCKSTNLKKVSLAYGEGLYRVDTRTRLTGVLIGSGGPDMVVGSARTKGLRQTELSKTLSPPSKWSYLKLVLWSGIISLVALVAYVNHVMASPPPVSALPVEVYAVLFSVAFVFLLILFWRHNHSTYQQLYAQWNRSFICERCGAMSQHELPDASIS